LIPHSCTNEAFSAKEDLMSNTIIILLLVFGACVLLVISASVLWSDLQTSGPGIKQRLKTNSAGAKTQSPVTEVAALTRTEVESPVSQALLGALRVERLNRYLQSSGLRLGSAAFLTLDIVTGLLGAGLVMAFSDNPGPLAFAFGLGAGAAVPWWVVARKHKTRKELMIKQLPDALDFFARSMRAGHPFASALKSASQEVLAPLSSEFEKTFDELNYGLEFEEVMQNLAGRINAEEVRFFVTAVLVQKSTGGNLAELMNRIASLLRERVRTRGEVMIQAAEMRGSARILIMLPIVVAGLLQIFNPEYLPVMLENDTGRLMIMIQICLMACGYMVIQRMINFRI
jgi:tight adherence protein B